MPVLDAHWATAALCGADPEAFFDKRAAYETRQVCWRCPVRRDCLAEVLDNPDPHGMWAGFTPQQRQQILTEHPQVVSWRVELATKTVYEATNRR